MKNTSEIPRVIHYCWFGKNKMPDSAIKCIESWKKYCPNYKIIQWNENNYNIEKCEYIKEAYKCKKWAFVSDYARFDVLNQYGGIYFDTDVELVKPIEDIIENGNFMGMEEDLSLNKIITDKTVINPGLGLAVKSDNKLLKEILKIYEKSKFIMEDGSYNPKTVVDFTTTLFMKYGFINKNIEQQIEDFTIYPKEYFCPMNYNTGFINITKNTHSIHHYTASWKNLKEQKIHKIEQKMLIKKMTSKIVKTGLWKIVKHLYTDGYKKTFQKSIKKVQQINNEKNKKYDVAFLHSTGELSSGASWSLIKLVEGLKKRGVNSLVVIPEKGSIEDKLKEKDIKYYVLRQYNANCWYVLEKKGDFSFFFKIKYIFKRGINFWSYLKLKRILKKNKVQIVHINTLTTYIGAIAAVSLKLKLVWHIREFMEEDLGFKFYNKQYSYNLIGKSNCIIAISKDVQQKYKRYLSPKIIKVIYNGVDKNKYYFEKKILEKDEIMILICGRITESKGQHELAQAIAILPEDIKRKVKCYIIGKVEDVKYYDKIKKFIDNNNLKDNIIFKNFTKDIQKYLHEADILCMCSKKEAFGRTTVEGMLSGCLVIGTNSGGTKEIIKDKINGMLYKSGDSQQLSNCIKLAVIGRKMAKKLAQNGQKEAKLKYTDDVNTERILEIYKEIL